MLKIGHRGASGYALENTRASFEKAKALFVDAIEFDVQRCASGELIIFHDDTVDRFSNHSGFIKNYSLKDLKDPSFFNNNYSLLTLYEGLEIIGDKIISNIELKAEGIVEDVVQVIEQFVADRGWSYDNFIVSSFDHHQLKKFKQLCSVVKIITLIEAIPLTYAQCAQDLNSEYLGLWKGSINQAFVKDAHARGIKVLVYTINSSYELETITLLGVDGIFSDFPDIF